MLDLCIECHPKMLADRELCPDCRAKIEKDENYLCDACGKEVMAHSVICPICVQNVVRHADRETMEEEDKDIRDDDPMVARLIKNLSLKQKLIISEVIAGASNKEIAVLFNTSPQVIKNAMVHIFDKVGCDTRAKLAAFVMEHPALKADIKAAD